MTILKISQITADDSTQTRVSTNESTVNEYRLDMLEGAIFPPVVVFYDGVNYWLADGFHRTRAATQIGKKEIEATVHKGGKREAILYGLTANSAHGLRRSNADKRRAVMRLLEDKEWSKWSDREIARRCRVSHPFVIEIRNSLTGNITSERTYITKHGTIATMQTANIGNRPNMADLWNADQERKRLAPSTIKQCPDCGELWNSANIAYCPYCNITQADRLAYVTILQKEQKKSVHFSSESDNWATPPDLFEILDNEFDFTLDVCASEQNTKCNQYFTVVDDGLTQDWRGVCWMNPPYGREIDQWMEKAYTSAKEGATVVCLVPARTDTGWWWNYAIKGEIRFIKRRLKFGDASNSAPFPSAVVVFYPGVSPHDEQVIWWGEWND